MLILMFSFFSELPEFHPIVQMLWEKSRAASRKMNVDDSSASVQKREPMTETQVLRTPYTRSHARPRSLQETRHFQTADGTGNTKQITIYLTDPSTTIYPRSSIIVETDHGAPNLSCIPQHRGIR